MLLLWLTNMYEALSALFRELLWQLNPLNSAHSGNQNLTLDHRKLSLWGDEFAGTICIITGKCRQFIRLVELIRSDDIGRGMPFSPLGSTDGQTELGVACHHRPWIAHRVGRRAWHAIIVLGQHKWSAVVGRRMPSYPWKANTIKRRRAWYAISAFGQHIRSNNVGRGMPSWPLDSTHGRTTSGVACNHSPWTAIMVERRRALHAIIAFGLADTVGKHRAWHAIISLGRKTRSNDVGHGMPSAALDSTHGQTTSGEACYHHLWEGQTIRQHRAWHAIFALRQHRRSAVVGRGMQ
uniref:Uncharacterized protein n=1 Tax=Solanum lycopersicum TaxID=4081 RepID=A0A3Q7GPQ5_SOLLC